MAFSDLVKDIETLNTYSNIRYHAFQFARNKKSDKYNDRKIHIYFENNGEYKDEKRLIKLFEIHEHRFGAIDSLSKYMGYRHEAVFLLILKYVLQRRSQRAPYTDGGLWYAERRLKSIR